MSDCTVPSLNFVSSWQGSTYCLDLQLQLCSLQPQPQFEEESIQVQESKVDELSHLVPPPPPVSPSLFTPGCCSLAPPWCPHPCPSWSCCARAGPGRGSSYWSLVRSCARPPFEARGAITGQGGRQRSPQPASPMKRRPPPTATIQPRTSRTPNRSKSLKASSCSNKKTLSSILHSHDHRYTLQGAPGPNSIKKGLRLSALVTMQPLKHFWSQLKSAYPLETIAIERP